MNKKEIKDNIKSLVIFIAIALCLRASVVEAFKIPSSSMENTLLIGDHILVNKLSYGLRLPLLKETVLQYDDPERGDIVVFTRPDDPSTKDKDESDTNIIKRVLGLPGDKIEVRGKAVILNGKVHEEVYPQYKYGGLFNFGPETIPEGHVLLLGDNRDESHDGRRWHLAGNPSPFLPVERIKGRAFIIYWNLSHLGRMFDVLH